MGVAVVVAAADQVVRMYEEDDPCDSLVAVFSNGTNENYIVIKN